MDVMDEDIVSTCLSSVIDIYTHTSTLLLLQLKFVIELTSMIFAHLLGSMIFFLMRLLNERL